MVGGCGGWVGGLRVLRACGLKKTFAYSCAQFGLLQLNYCDNQLTRLARSCSCSCSCPCLPLPLLLLWLWLGFWCWLLAAGCWLLILATASARHSQFVTHSANTRHSPQQPPGTIDVHQRVGMWNAGFCGMRCGMWFEIWACGVGMWCVL